MLTKHITKSLVTRITRSLIDFDPRVFSRLQMWLDASDNTTITKDASNLISSVTDKSGEGNNAVQATSTFKPTLVASAINGLDGISFDGISDRLGFDGSIMVGTPYTVFIVELKGDSGQNFFMGGEASTSDNENFHMGYLTNTYMRAGQYGPGNFVDYSNGALNGLITRLHSFTNNTSIGKDYWYNGGTSPVATNTNKDTLISYGDARIGNTQSTFYKGLIGEVLIYDRALSDDEVQTINSALISKWNVGS